MEPFNAQTMEQFDQEMLPLYKEAAPVVLKACKEFNWREFKELIGSEFHVNFPITDLKMSVLSYLCSFDGDLADENKQVYVNMLQAVFTKKDGGVRQVNLDQRDLMQRSAMHYAVRAGNVIAVQFLIQAATKLARDTPGFVSRIINSTSSGSISPLMFAAALGREDFVRFLLEHGANHQLVDARMRNAEWYARVNH